MSVPSWLAYSIACLVCFGLWGFFSRLALESINPKQVLIFQTIGIGLVTTILLGQLDRHDLSLKGSTYAILTGMAFTLGSILFFMATDKHEKVSVVVTVTALYPVVTLCLAWFFLKESFNLTQSLGVFLAVVAVLLISL